MGHKNRTIFILLGLFFGSFGVHNFYAGYMTKALIQLTITLFLGWLYLPFLVVAIWAWVEIFTIKKDSRGVPFK